MSGLWGPTLKSEYPEVEDIVRSWWTDIWVAANDRVFQEDVRVVDPNYFEVFDFELIHGDRSTVLREHGGAVISESMARRFFDDEDPIGQTIVFEDLHFDISLKVTGIMADAGPETSWQFESDCVTATLRTGLGRDLGSACRLETDRHLRSA